MNRLDKNPKWHWSKQPNAKEILERMSATKRANPKTPWLGKNHSLETKLKISKSRKGKCLAENHPQWKGGVVSKNQKIRNSMEYILWRNEVYRRDKWTCRICNMHCKNGQIVAHHLKKFSDYPELRFVINNGLTLCRKCHAEVDNPQHI